MKSGILLIDKAKGTTSREEVNFLMRSFNEKKMGHVGTLDPFADGLLLVLIDKGTKISPYLEIMDKEYFATLKLGVLTDTADLTGKVIEKKEVPELSKDKIKEIFASMLGEQYQLPPMYSAIKVNGKQLYKYARSGEEIEREKRRINIYSLELINYTKDTITFVTRVSKGTYIRTLGEDIASKLGTVGHLIALTRTKVGPYSLNNAVKKEDAKEENVVGILDSLSFMKKHEVKEEEHKMISNGMHVKISETEPLVLCVYNDEPLAIYRREENGYYKCERGLR